MHFIIRQTGSAVKPTRDGATPGSEPCKRVEQSPGGAILCL